LVSIKGAWLNMFSLSVSGLKPEIEDW
jgi:hypothetical protein